MNRREFISMSAATLCGAAVGTGCVSVRKGSPPMSWHRHKESRLFDGVAVDGRPLLVPDEGVGLCDGFCQAVENGKLGREVVLGADRPEMDYGPIRVSLSQQLRSSSGGAREDLLEATLTLRSRADRPYEVFCGFLTSVRPCANPGDQQVYAPVTAAGLRDPDDDKRRRQKDCLTTVGTDGFLAHYLEPQSSDPRQSTTRAALLAPVVDISAEAEPCHVTLFTSSTEPALFQALQGPSSRAWRIGRRVRLEPGQTQVVTAYILLHSGDASAAWKVFHRFGHREDFPALAWPRKVRVHYFDFLSSAEADSPRGGGYDLDLKHFGEFRVGMATQHGYYLSYGDFIHPDRKEWKAMPNDPAGPVAMSIEKIKARVDATRRAGVHPAIYMHYTILDEGSPLFEKMRDSILVNAAGDPTVFGWEGPDVIKKTWRMSPASPQWRDHLVQQAQWIMELFNPDAIVLDETFTAWGWDHHKEHGGPVSPGGIDLMRRLRAVVRSFGPDKALFASDCSMANFCLWGDGEGGDHCYDRLLGNELYRKPPIRYMAALGEKAWLPCAWLYKSLWPAQVDLARKAGAAVGVTNGWGDSFGLARLPENARQQMLRDIKTL
ncbi:MAG TPA: hypothetical protein PKH24_05545 [Sedimentisphaerales bacterium]|jgi:hypothetical protein|nr:hypothetical protein [Sedimentisphaerales bacterium]HNU28986.1 hypothetical protein [Sedimentisphaerales bacterium]